jgi:hypothetical protein
LLDSNGTFLMPPEDIADRLAGFQIAGEFGRLRTRIQQRLHRGGMVSRLPVPAIFGAVERAPQCRDFMLAAQFELGMIPQKLPDHLRVSMPGRPLYRCHLVLTPCIHRPACGNHESHGAGIVVLRGIREPPAIVIR